MTPKLRLNLPLLQLAAMHGNLDFSDITQMLDSSADALLICDNDGKIQHCNSVLALMFGYQGGELTGQPVDILIPEQFRSVHHGYIQNYLDSPSVRAMMNRDDFYAAHRTGQVFAVKISLSRLNFDAGQYIFIAIHDISRRKEAEQQLAQFTAELEGQVNQRTSELIHANKQLKDAKAAIEQANQAKSEFIATMSHGLRTPLNSIIGFSEYLVMAEKDPEKLDSLKTINDNGRHLLALVSDLLNVSAIESKNIQFKMFPVNMRELFRSVARSLRFSLAQKNIGLTLVNTEALPAWIESDDRVLKQIFFNILNNTIQHSGGTQITVSANSTLCGSDSGRAEIQFEIKDDGVGIPAAEIETMFQPFSQIGTANLAADSVGLGLYISKQYAQKLNGDLTASSEPGAGTQFRLSFEAALTGRQPLDGDHADQQKQSAPTTGLTATGHPNRILVVEDNVTNAIVLKKLLERAGLTVQVARNGREGVDQWKSWGPHFIWMDIQMPIMDGLEATRTIRSEEQHHHLSKTPIVALTANTYEVDYQRAMEAGCNGFIGKPFKAQQLYDVMHEHLSADAEKNPGPLAKLAPGTQNPL